MEYINKKRCRKTKLVPREYMDSDDEDIAAMQEEIEETIARMTTNSILTKLSRTKEEPLTFSIKVEVEEVDECFEREENELNIAIDSVVSLKTEAIESPNSPEKTSVEATESDTKSQTKQFKFKSRTILNELDRIRSTDIADKLIAIHIRNYFGRYFSKINLDVREFKLRAVLDKWKFWCRTNPDERDAPLLYKCFICNKSWWHYQEFKEHFRGHGDFKLDLEQFGQECIIVAYMAVKSKEEIHIDENCWRCGKDFTFHMNKRRYRKLYDCSGCLGKYTTCLKLNNHVGSCNFYKRSMEILGRQVDGLYPCSVCPVKCYSRTDFDQHTISMHCVRSDIPVLTTYSQCKQCGLICDELTHECRCQPLKNSCGNCNRKFDNLINHQLHMNFNSVSYKCRVCDEYMPAQCMELQHLLKHTTTFTTLFKCLHCPGPVYFTKQTMVENHYTKSHENYKPHQYFYDEVPVPLSLLTKQRSHKNKQNVKTKEKLNPIKGEFQEIVEFKGLDVNQSENTSNLEIVVPNDCIREIKQEMIDLNYDDIDNINQVVVKQEVVDHVLEICRMDEIKVEIKDEPIDDGMGCDELTEKYNNLRNLDYNCTKIYSCKKCLFQGLHREFQRHLKSKCMVHIVYHCTKCSKSFVSMKKYLTHFINHNYEANSCPKCLKTMEIGQLVTHVYQHIKSNFIGCHFIKDSSSDKCYQCRECRDKVQFNDFFEHWESHMQLREAVDHCGINDPNEKKPLLKKMIALLLSDSPEASGEFQPKQCIVCLKMFSRKNDLKRHLIEHLLSDAYRNRQKYECLKCQICSVGFNKTDIYKRHMRDHGALPLYKCQICDKTFSDSSNFSKHKKVHNLSVVICDICKKKFTCKAILIKHMMLHDKLKPIRCDCCDRIFHTPSMYRKHRAGKVRFKCYICNVLFNKLKDKWDHMWLEHKERKYLADCPICSKSFRKYQEVKVHIRTEHDPKYVYRPLFLKVDTNEIIVCD